MDCMLFGNGSSSQAIMVIIFMSFINDLKRLIAIHNRRLQKLMEQKAILGLFADPRISIEIEDIEIQINNSCYAG